MDFIAPENQDWIDDISRLKDEESEIIKHMMPIIGTSFLFFFLVRVLTCINPLLLSPLVPLCFA